MEVADILKQIEKGDFQSVAGLIEEAPPQTRSEVIAKVSQAMTIAISFRDSLIAQYRDRLAKFLEFEDESFPDFSIGVIDSINTPLAALRASTYYDVTWFNSLSFDTSKKVLMAQKLIDKVSEFNKSYCPQIWKSIANQDPSVIAAITYINPKFLTDQPQELSEEL